MFLRSIIEFHLYKKINFLSQHIMMENPKPEEENIIKDIRNPFRLRKELNYTTIKDKRNLFRIEKKLKQLKKEYLEI